MYWQKEIECMSRDALQALQLKRLQAMVKRIYENVPFYREKFQAMGLEPGDVKTLDDLAKLPFTYKTDLRDHYPLGLKAVPQSELIRIHASSGTTGKPTVVCYTQNDINLWAEIVARGLVCTGVTKDDIVQVSYGYGLFTGGLGLHYGAEKMGAVALPTSSGNTRRQLMLMRDLKTAALACTPSYALFLSEALADEGLSPEEIPLKIGVFGAEPWSEEMRQKLEQNLGIKAYDIYGLSEIAGPGVSIECQAQQGSHVWEDHFIVEIINPETGEVLPPGSMGEIVFTTITKEGLPLLRYRTRDLCRLNVEKCACGRTHARMDRITGRSDDMLIIRGVNVFPSQVESVLLKMDKTAPHFHMIVDRQGNLDSLEIQVEVNDTLFNDQVKGMENLRSLIKKEIETVLGISSKITLVEPRSIPRSEGKNNRVTDNRKL